MNSLTLADLMVLREGFDIEFKEAGGKEKKGAIPASFWETYSAFANGAGGEIYLGVKEDAQGEIKISGIANPAKVMQELFDLANNAEKISCNLLHDHSAEILLINEKTILKISVPRASRKERPVYVGANPLKGSYIRKNAGDYRIPADTVKKMLGEQSEESCDAMLLKGFDFKDFDLETVQVYRNTFVARQPTHPFVGLELKDFLKKIRAWTKNREAQEEGPTLAGLLMFGKLSSILDELPYYQLDYQEWPETKAENRWIDRLTTDGNWSGNLYDFYRRVYQKMIADLKIPFRLENGVRVEETPVHEALREALVNTLIHADYKGHVSLLIVKRPDMFSFRNPGLMRVPIEQALDGGDSDCRNANLQHMFQLIGISERAGSGIPKIYQSWEQQHWRRPRIVEKVEPAQTRFELHMASLLSQEVLQELEQKFGEKFEQLTNKLERIILGTASSEGVVDHKRIREIDAAHPADISKALHALVRKGFLIQDGAGRGASYQIKNSSIGLGDSFIGLSGSSIGLNGSFIGLDENSLEQQEHKIAEPAIQAKKMNLSQMQAIIYDLCSVRPQKIERLAVLLNRDTVYLRNTHLRPMILSKKIKMLYPDKPQHPEQAYLAIGNAS